MDEQENNKWHLDKKISLTHMFATISAIGTLVIFGSNLTTRVALIEQALTTYINEQKNVDHRQDIERNEIKKQMREDYARIDSKLDRIIERTK